MTSVRVFARIEYEVSSRFRELPQLAAAKLLLLLDAPAECDASGAAD